MSVIPEKLATRIRELLRRKAKFSVELTSYDGRWRKWRIAEHDTLGQETLDPLAEDGENGGTTVEK